jgi:hypothetical protein
VRAVNIQRYTLHGNPKANDKGRWVRFSDHEKALKALAEKPLPPLPPDAPFDSFGRRDRLNDREWEEGK